MLFQSPMSLGKCHSDSSTLAIESEIRENAHSTDARTEVPDLGSHKWLSNEKDLAEGDVNEPFGNYRGSRSSTDSYINGHRLQDDGEKGPLPQQDDEQDHLFEVQWNGDHDPMNPRNMSKARKWMIVLVVSMSSLCV